MSQSMTTPCPVPSQPTAPTEASLQYSNGNCMSLNDTVPNQTPEPVQTQQSSMEERSDFRTGTGTSLYGVSPKRPSLMEDELINHDRMCPQLDDPPLSPYSSCGYPSPCPDEDDGNAVVHYLADLDFKVAENIFSVNRDSLLCMIDQPNHMNQTPLYRSVMVKNCLAAWLFLSHGANPNIQGMERDNDTNNLVSQGPLHKAVELGDCQMVGLLIQSEVINLELQRHYDKKTPLMVALQKHVAGSKNRDRQEIIKQLVEMDANLHVFDDLSDKTILMMTIETRDVELVEYLLNHVGVERSRDLINQPNKMGNTAMHIAAGLNQLDRDSHLRLLKVMKYYGGNTDAQNLDLKTPKDWAKSLFDQVNRLGN